MKNYFNSNLKKLAEKYSQKQIALDTGMSPASINNYINKGSEPSLFFLSQLKKSYDLNLDEFLFTDLVSLENKSGNAELAKRFGGNFLIYYYDTSFYKGSSNFYTKNAINYGIISVFSDPQARGASLTAYALFLLEKKEAEEVLKALNSMKNAREIKNYYQNLSDKYEGALSANYDHIFIRLKSPQHKDEAFIILNNPPSRKSYVGGVGTVNSISRGREHMPCVQYSILSRYALSVTEGELYNLLTLNNPEINVDLQVEQLIKLFHSLYVENQNNLSLTNYQKMRIIEESLKNTLSGLLETNIFRFAKISDMEDDQYYRLIKEEFINE